MLCTFTFPPGPNAQEQRYQQVQQRIFRAGLRSEHALATKNVLQGIPFAEGYHVQGD